MLAHSVLEAFAKLYLPKLSKFFQYLNSESGFASIDISIFFILLKSSLFVFDSFSFGVDCVSFLNSLIKSKDTMSKLNISRVNFKKTEKFFFSSATKESFKI